MKPFQGRSAALATKHAKERAIARPMRAALGLAVVVPPGLDTDTLGTFTLEVPRPAPPRETAVLKARLGMAAAGTSAGIASEGAFGPHPNVPYLASALEVVVFVDDERGLVVFEEMRGADTNFGHRDVRPGDDLRRFLRKAGFPAHALVVHPVGAPGIEARGVVDESTLAAAIAAAAARSPEGRARVETDMRAHLNPTRMTMIRRVAFRLARRLATPCPACGVPGYGMVDVERGLPCADCGERTTLVSAEVHGCPSCGARARLPRRDGRTDADPRFCGACNP